uniref:Poly [ADP-ribose] polymerase 12-like n=1 Tax=Sinocyclocheilus grahami TaxID=75366 RepID=A0A672LER8_SINGR
MTEAAIVKKLCAQNGSISFDALISMLGLFDHEAVDSLVGRSESFAVAFVNGQKKVIARTKVRLCRVQSCPGCDQLKPAKDQLKPAKDQLKPAKDQLKPAKDQLKPAKDQLKPAKDQLKPAKDQLKPAKDQLKPAKDQLKPAKDQLKPAKDQLKPAKDQLKPAKDQLKPAKDQLKPAKDQLKPAKDQHKPPSQHQNIPNQHMLFFFNRKTEICMYFVKGHCKHGSCWKEHSTLPYKWEVKEGSEWKALPDNEAIEKDYCDAARTYSSGMNPVYFDTMTQGCYSVRRLSTVPSVLQPTFILTTEWIWYWEDEYGNWIQYATADGGHGLSSISSAELEQKFQADSNAVVEFTAGSQTYELSFTDMIQTNKRYTTKKIIRRRPKFVSAADVRTIKTTKRTPNNFKALPEHWDKALTPETGYKSVSLQSTSAEHIKIKELFSRTMFGFRILKIQRIQNKALWEVYQWQKDFMKKNNGGRDVTEKQLFHGTDSTHLDAICHNNFDWRICGTHGTAYGKGSYFARDAKYSHGYTKDSGTRSMFVCRILVGSYTKGESSYLRPPSKDGGDTVFYDSCVNDVFDPSIFVVFEKHQIYPEYLIEYRDVGGFDSPSRPAVANPAVAVRSRVAVPVVTRHIPSTNASSSYSSSSNNPFYKPSSAARRHYTASYISSSSASSSSSSRASASQSHNLHASTPPKSSKSECIIS